MTTPARKPAPALSAALSTAILAAAKDPRTPASRLLHLSRLAELEGATATAEALSSRAAGNKPAVPVSPVVSDTGRAEAPSPAAAPGVQVPNAAGSSALTSSPLTADAWDRYAAAVKACKAPDAENKGRIGIYGFSIPRLADLGVVTDPKKVRTEGRSSPWTATWTNPTKEAFEADVEAQGALLRKSAAEHVKKIREKFAKALGKQVSGKTITLSGLLAVAHVAGEKGLESWLRDGAVRKKFPGTTKVFEAANGIF